MGKLYVTITIKHNDAFVRMKVNGVLDAFVTYIYDADYIREIYLN